MEGKSQNNDKLVLKLLAKMLKSTGKAAAKVFETAKEKGLPLLLAVYMAFNLVSCDLTETPDASTSTNSSYSDVIGSNDSSLGGDSSTDSSTDNKPEDKYSQYSELIQEMLKDNYYSTLLMQAKQDPNFYYSPYFDPHPYTFLEEQGHDVEKVKSGEYECKTQAFIKEEEPNNLYIATYVENAGGYYAEYMLKYELKDEEISDYKNFHSTKYVQATFLNDWISANKKCTIISCSKVDINTHKAFETDLIYTPKAMEAMGFQKKKLFLIFTSANEETRTFDIFAMQHIKELNNMTTSGKIAVLPMKAWLNYSFDNDMIYFTSCNSANFEIYEVMDKTDAKIYYSQTTNLSPEYNNTIKDISKE